MLTISHCVLSLRELSAKMEARATPVKHLVLRDCRILSDASCRAGLPGLASVETLEVDCRGVGQLHALWMVVDDPLEPWNEELRPLREGLRTLVVHGDLATGCLTGQLGGLTCLELVGGVMSVHDLRGVLRVAPSLERVNVKEIMHEVVPGAAPVRDLPLSLELTLGVLDPYALESVRLVQAHACPVRSVVMHPGADVALILTEPVGQAEAMIEWMAAGAPAPLVAVADATERLSVVTTFNPSDMDVSTLAELVQALCTLLPGASGLSLVCTDDGVNVTEDADRAVLRVLPPTINSIRRFDDANLLDVSA